MPEEPPFYDPTPRISGQELSEMLRGEGEQQFGQIVIIDARFEYEFQEGHIAGAINVTNLQQMVNVYNRFLGQNVCMVFYCVDSLNRSMMLMHRFRGYDRERNMTQYPNLNYPNIFMLDGGIVRFYQEHPDLCRGRYLPMNSSPHAENGEMRRKYHEFHVQFRR